MLAHKEMTAKEAVRAAKEESGLTTEQIARRLKVSTSVVKRYLKEDDAYFPRLDMLPRLCLALGNTLLLDWAEAQVGQGIEDQKEDMLLFLANAIEVLEEMQFFIERTETFTCREEERGFLPKRAHGCGKKHGIWCPLWKFWQKCLRGTPRR